MVPLDVWVKKVREIKNKFDSVELGHYLFFRDPPRPCFVDPEVFYSPADGIILYIKCVDSDDSLIEIKGVKYTLKDAMQMDLGIRALVIGIFMSQYDVHVNRVPIDSVLVEVKKLDSVKTRNLPMIYVEKDLVDLARVDVQNKGDYLFANARVLNRFLCTSCFFPYWILQIADEDVDVISHFGGPYDFFHQNKRFSFVRWGSQVDVVVPLVKGLKFKLLAKEEHHVSAGIDGLFRLESV